MLRLTPPPASTAFYKNTKLKLPNSLEQALHALHQDATFTRAFGTDFVDSFTQIKRQKLAPTTQLMTKPRGSDANTLAAFN